MNQALELKSVSKAYVRGIKAPGLMGALKGLFSQEKKIIDAVKQLSFTVKSGEAVGLIGENGAGKSTTMKLCTGILRPSGGDLTVLGYSPWKDRRHLALKIGVVFGQRPQLLWDIAVRESFELLRIMYRIPDALFKETSALAEKLLELKPLLATPVRQLSLGQRMRADLACAFLHAPQVAFLDEPTIGLDVLAKEQARSLIKSMRRRFGMSLILTTHDLKDITDTCERVVLLDKGALLFDGSLKGFEKEYAREKRVVVDLDRPLAAAKRRALGVELKRVGAKLLKSESQKVVASYEKNETVRRLTQTLVKRLEIADMSFEKTDMEAIVRHIYSSQAGKRA